MGRMETIKKDKFEKLLEDGYGVKAISCFFGVSTVTLGTWAKQNYNKTVKEIYLERRKVDGKTKNRN